MSNPVLKKNKYSREFIEEIKENVKPIIDEVIKPNAEIIDREGKFPRENF